MLGSTSTYDIASCGDTSGDSPTVARRLLLIKYRTSMSLLNGKGIVDTIIERYIQLGTAKYLSIVTWTVLGYDWLISIDLEVAYIWRTPWSPGRVAYHFNRLWPIIIFGSAIPIFLFAPAPHPMTCKKATQYYAYGLIVELSSICAVLLMRCWALYNDKRILRGLSAGLFFTILLSIILVKITMDKVVYIANPFPSVFTGCVILLPSTMWMLYVVPLIYDSTMFIMTVLRIYVLSSEYGATPLMERLAENGALHSGVLVVLMMFSCIGGTVETVKIAANGSGILGAISSVVCSRIIFSLHTLAEDEANKRLPFSEDKDTSGDIRFAVPLHELSNSSSTSYGSVPFK